MSRCSKQRIAALMFCAVSLATATWLWTSGNAAERASQPLKSQVVRQEAAVVHRADWGEMRRYFSGETFGTKDAFTAVAVVEPGKSVHRAHRHAEEEYLALVEGSGNWHLAGKEFPAKAGDVLYVEPWVYHGLTNTGDKPLVFVVVKFSGKGISIPPRPDDQKDEL